MFISHFIFLNYQKIVNWYFYLRLFSILSFIQINLSNKSAQIKSETDIVQDQLLREWHV